MLQYIEYIDFLYFTPLWEKVGGRVYWRAKMYFSASSASNASHGSTFAALLHLSVQFYLPEKKGLAGIWGSVQPLAGFYRGSVRTKVLVHPKP